VRYLLAIPPFQRIVQRHDQWLLRRDDRGEEQSQEQMTQGERGPNGTVEHPVIGREVVVILQTDSA
jgi:hypothetical protein